MLIDSVEQKPFSSITFSKGKKHKKITMDMLRVNQVMKRQKQVRRKKKSIKVVYISSPMKVETSASKFRALVQELTGRDSDVARFMESSINSQMPMLQDHHQGFKGTVDDDFLSRVPDRESPTSSDSLLMFQDVFVPQMEEGFMADYLYESPYSQQVDMLGSFDDL